MKALLLVSALLASPGAPAEGPEAQLLVAMQASLPIDVVATDLRIVGRGDWSPGAELIVSWERGNGPGRRMAKVVVQDEAETYKTWASVRIAALRKVLVTTRPLGMGAVLSEADLELALRPVAKREALDFTLESLVGQPVLRDLAAGEVLGKRDVALPAPVPRGTAVRVVSEVRGVRIEVPGTLVSSVRPGGRGRARIEASRRPLAGRLLAPDRFVLEVGR